MKYLERIQLIYCNNDALGKRITRAFDNLPALRASPQFKVPFPDFIDDRINHQLKQE